MTYKILRDAQEFGPYSLSDVQRYVGTGNILLTDLARAEGETEWISVAQVVGTIAVLPSQAQAGYAAMNAFPEAPNLNWGIVLLLDLVTCGIFTIIWNLIQAFWIKKVQPDTKAPLYYFIVLGLALVNIVVAVARVIWTMHARAAGNQGMYPLVAISGLATLASLVMQWIIYPFAMRASLMKHFNEVDPVGLQLSGVMTFFFGSIYFQYHLNRIHEIKRAYRLANPY